MIMKKWLALILALAMSLSLCACGGGETEEPAADEETAATEVEEETTEEEPAADELAVPGIQFALFETAVEGHSIEANTDSKFVHVFLKTSDGKNAAYADVKTSADQAAYDKIMSLYEDPAKCTKADVTIAEIPMTAYTYLAPAGGWENTTVYMWEMDGNFFDMYVQYNYQDSEAVIDAAAADTFVAEVVANLVAVPR